MLRITASPSAPRAKRYFGEGLARDDYYSQGQEIAGHWFGKGAAELGLEGEVDQARYFALCDNRNPETGERLTPRQKDNRRPMFDWTFSAPKAVSVLYEVSGDERIAGAFQTSFRETMGDAEAEMKTRVRKGGKDEDRVTGNLVGAEFIHFTARPVDGRMSPHLHAHCVVFNVTRDGVEERWKASQQGDLKRDADYWEAAFHARFAKRLNDMGYQTVKDGTSFTLAAVPRSLTEKFSERRNLIEAKAKERGISDAKAKHALGARLREAKRKDRTRESLRGEWKARLSLVEDAALKRVIQGGDVKRGGDGIDAEKAMAHSLEHSFERASAVSERRLQAEALRHGVGTVLPEDVAALASRDDVIAREIKGRRMATTKGTLRDEVAMLEFASASHGRCKPLVAKPEGLDGLTDEQKRAAMHVLRSRDRVTGIGGKAGTGKTHLMKFTVAQIERHSGKQVFVFAPSSQASRGVLKREGFDQAETLAMLLKNEKLQAQTRGQVLWVDEAGLVSSRDMRKLMDVAKKGGNRVILSGDYAQHASVEAGDAFRLLEREAGVKLANLTEIRRQTEPGYRKAVEAIARGGGEAAQQGFDALDRMGYVTQASGEKRHERLVADYLQARDEGKSALVIAPTHAEGRALTEALRHALRGRGALGNDREVLARRSTGWTKAQKSDARNYEPGLIVEFHQNAKGFKRGDKAVVAEGDTGLYVQKTDGSRAALPLGQADRFEVYRSHAIALARGDRIRITRNGDAKVAGQAKATRLNNGDILAVEGFDKQGNIRLEKGKLLPKNWGHLAHGFVDTSYGAQGKTVDRVFISVGSESLPAANRQQWYVSASRGREAAKIYVDSKREARNAIARAGERLSAVEMTGTRIARPGWRARFAQALERNRVARFLKARSDAAADYRRNRTRERGQGYGRT